jgi:tetratricopeptide (TPR) repeat protein
MSCPLHLSRHLALVALAAALLATPRVAAAQANERVAALYRASYRLEASRDPRGALAKMREIRTLAGASYFVAVRTAWLQYLVGDFGGAAASYREAQGRAPKAIEPRLGLTLPLLAQHRWRDLERACREVLALDPHNATARARLAHALYSVGNYPDAAGVYRKLVAEYPSVLDHQTGLGWALLRMGRRAEAQRHFTAVLAVSPDNANARAGMAQH